MTVEPASGRQGSGSLCSDRAGAGRGIILKVFFSAGQIGNQLFQITAAQRITGASETLILIGFGESFELIESAPRDGRVLQLLRLRQETLIRRVLTNFTFKSLQKFAEFLLSKRWVGRIKDSPDGPVVEQESRSGISIALHAHFRGIFLDAASEFRLAAARVKSAHDWLDGEKIERDGNGIARATFLHVRRGDYLEWPNPAHPAMLEKEWFDLAIEQVRDSKPSQPIVVFSDDPDWVRENWRLTRDFLLFKGSSADSFAVMSTCHSGILSPSTFSWWATNFMRDLKSGPFIAPMYWWGHRQKKWPEEPFQNSSFLTFI